MRVVRAASILLVLAAGCSSAGKSTLSGKVTYQGKPVVTGVVSAFCSDGITRSSNIAEDGSYKIEAVPAGAVRFAVSSPEPIDPTSLPARPDRRGGSNDAVPPPPAPNRAKWVKLPEKYENPQTAERSTTVKGDAVFDLKLD